MPAVSGKSNIQICMVKLFWRKLRGTHYRAHDMAAFGLTCPVGHISAIFIPTVATTSIQIMKISYDSNVFYICNRFGIF